MHYQYYGKHIAIKITKWHNSCNTDPSAPIFLQNMQCLVVKVWCKFEQNRARATKVTEQNLKKNDEGMTESWYHGRLKTVYPPKTTFCGGINTYICSPTIRYCPQGHVVVFRDL